MIGRSSDIFNTAPVLRLSVLIVTVCIDVLMDLYPWYVAQRLPPWLSEDGDWSPIIQTAIRAVRSCYATSSLAIP